MRRTTSVSGTALNNAIVEVYRTTNDPGLYGPGESFVGSTVASSSGAWSINATLPAGAIVTATATAYANINTSEFAAERRSARGAPGGPRRDVLELDGLLRHHDDEHPASARRRPRRRGSRACARPPIAATTSAPACRRS